MGASCPGRCFEGLRGRPIGLPGALRDGAVEGFAAAFGGLRPTALGVAPGRAEVLGNHTDYNEGFILSAAIDRFVIVAGRVNTGGTECRIASADFPGVVTFSAAKPLKQTGQQAWANYVMGVVSELSKLGAPVGAFDAFVASNVPAGAGVSSSAAIEMATAKLLSTLFPTSVAGALDDIGLIKACKAAENNFVGMGCGILDQFSSGKGKAGQLVFLDCRTLDYSYAPFRDAQFVLANTNAPHALVDGQYDELRRQCFLAADAFRNATGNSKITHLRDVDGAIFDAHAASLPEAQRRRAKHIVFEDERVHRGIKALKEGDMATLGAMMSQSHISSRDDFGNSSKELDLMVECAQGIDGFLGCRLMGGGFGGSTINLVRAGSAETFGAELAQRYEAKRNIKPTVLICQPADGAWHEQV